MQRVKIGVAGAGKMGQNHIRVLHELNGVFDLVGIYDPLPEKEAIARKYGVKFFGSYEEMLDEVQAVSLPCPTSLHKKMALTAAEKGCHVLVEKPISETPEEASELCEAFAQRNLVFTVGHIERFNPVVRAVSEIVDGMDVVAVEVHRCSPFDKRIYDVDVVSDLMVHDIDIVMNAIGKGTPAHVFSIGKKVNTECFADFAQATMTFPDETMAIITTSRSTEHKIRTLCVHAKGAYIEGDMLNRTLTVRRDTSYYSSAERSSIKYCQSNIIEQITLPNTEPLKEELLDFGNAVLHGTKPAVSGEQVLRVMEVLGMVKTEIYGKMEAAK